MTRDVGREAGLIGMVVASVLALASTGSLVGALAVLVLPVAAFAPWLRGRVERWPFTALLGVLGLVVVAGASWRSAADAVAAGLVGLMLHQRLAPPRDRNDRLVVLIAALLLLAASREPEGAGFLVAWWAWTACLPLALTPEDLPPGGAARRRRWLVVLATPALALALFVVAPRPATGPVGEAPAALVGLSQEVRLGDLVAVRGDPSLIAEVTGDALPTRLRAAALEDFDGRRWARVDRAGESPPPPAGDGVVLRTEQAGVGGVVLLAGAVRAWVVPPPRVMPDGAGAWWTTEPGALTHEARVVTGAPLPPASLDDGDRERLLAVPADLDGRLPGLAASITAGAPDDAARLAAIVGWVARTSTYTLRVGPGGADPLAAFVFEHHRGHCEHHAAAVAVLARLSGLPARLVVGLTRDAVLDGRARFRASGAHAWAEVHVDGVGWVMADATEPLPAAPAAETPVAAVSSSRPGPAPIPAAASGPGLAARAWEALRAYDHRSQAALLRAAAPALFVGGLLAGLVVVIRRWPPPRPRGARVTGPRDGVAGELDRAMAAAVARAGAPPEDLPPLAAARWLAADLGDAGAGLVELAWLYYEVSHGGADEGSRRARAEALADAVVGGR